MSNYLNDLEEAIRAKLFSYASDLGEINNREVQKIEWVKVNLIGGLPEKESTLFSGKEISIKPEGSIRFIEKLPNSNIAQGVTMKFWSLNMKISFNNENEQFVVNEIGDFGAFD